VLSLNTTRTWIAGAGMEYGTKADPAGPATSPLSEAKAWLKLRFLCHCCHR
jgi:hypothetical protein